VQHRLTHSRTEQQRGEFRSFALCAPARRVLLAHSLATPCRYGHKMHTSRLFAHDLTVVDASALLLFGGDVVVRHREGVVLVGGWVRLRASPKTAVVCVNPAVCLTSLCRHVTVLSVYLPFRPFLSWDDAFDWELRKRVCGSVRGACSFTKLRITSGSPDTPSPYPPAQPPTQLFRYKSLRVALDGVLTDLIARRVRGPSDDAASQHAQHSSPLLALIRELLAYDPSEL